jgi:hypothetical protein
MLTVDHYEDIARAFHEVYERMAPTFGYHTRQESAVSWDEVPETNKLLMRDVVQSLVEDDYIEVGREVLLRRPAR